MVDSRFPLLRKYLAGSTYEEIGKELRITRERVRQKIEREKALFFRQNSYLKQRIKNILSRNGFFYSFRRENRLLRLLKLMTKEENFKFSTLTVKKRRVFIVIPSHRKNGQVIEDLEAVKREIFLPIELKEAYKFLKSKGFSHALISLFFKLYDAALKNGEVVRCVDFQLKRTSSSM